ncbi:hypothetical protein [Pseudothioclava nitratireducens]|uniref:hypothetical protein n=1 Tax=Pseudothioclava nitratireducens TaxID=1928646 RepID=UPI0023DCC1FD|nr:hypothetical protein [Defluviimonas nitratireducens]MDF1621344.1 hypothetical protein [Defluviimonas nitratireducens]
MFVIAGLVIGAIWGDRRAKARGGNGFDRAQYAAVHAIALALLGLIITLIVDRMSRGG